MNAPTVVSRREGPGAPDRAAASRGSRGPHGLLWLVLRTHRASLWGWAALTAVVAGGLMWVHSHGAEAERIADYGACGAGPGVEAKVPRCPDFDFMSMFDFGADVIAWLPFVVAVFAGGVLVARDLENGTGALAWTQSVTPVRWLIAKLAVVSTFLLAGTLLLTTLIRWVWTSYDKSLVNPWYLTNVFHATGVVSLAYTLLALAVGALAGLLARRTLPAMGLGFAGFLPLYLAFDRYRAELWPTVRWNGLQASRIPDDAEQIKTGMITSNGTQTNNAHCFDRESAAGLERCLNRQGGTDVFADVHPSSHYWPIQFVETGIVLVLAAVVIWVACRLLSRRTAS